jgi:hypothetical protein
MNTHYMMAPDNQIVELMTDGKREELTFFCAENLKKVCMYPIVPQNESKGFAFSRVWAAIKRECFTMLAERSVTQSSWTAWREDGGFFKEEIYRAVKVGC